MIIVSSYSLAEFLTEALLPNKDQIKNSFLFFVE
jgi:hypothetical protein